LPCRKNSFDNMEWMGRWSGIGLFRACLALRWIRVWLNFKFFIFVKIECVLYFLDRFDVLISKMIFKKWKNIVGMYLSTKNYLKSNHYHTAKHTLNVVCMYLMLTQANLTSSVRLPGLASNFSFLFIQLETQLRLSSEFQVFQFNSPLCAGTFLILKNVW